MEFSVNHPLLFVLVGIIIAVVLAQSAYFLVKAYRRAIALGVSKEKLKKTILQASIFTIAPAVSIVISVILLSQSLGIALPWLRLSVVGSLSYETVAAANAASGLGVTLSDLVGTMTASQFVTILIVMTVSILVGIWLVPLLAKRMQKGLSTFESKDKRWSEILQNSLFLGMISAFVGFVFCDVSRLWSGNADGLVEVVKKVTENGEKVEKTVYYTTTSGLVPMCVMGVSAVVMIVLGLLSKKVKKAAWLSDYALPISLLIGMASAIPFVALLGGEVTA